MTSDQISYGVASPLTITVRALRAQHEGAEMLVQLLLENGEHQEQKSLVITTEQYCEFKLTRGLISEEVYEQLEEAAELCRALRSGESLLSYGANSVQALTRKLIGKGYKREVAAQAAERLAIPQSDYLQLHHNVQSKQLWLPDVQQQLRHIFLPDLPRRL